MKLGLNSAILDTMNFQELIDFSAEVGFQSVEVACWPRGTSERRYAGVSHIDVVNLDEKAIHDIHACLDKKHVSISALAYYPNPLDPDPQVRQTSIDHLKKVIVAANKLGVGMVTTFIGRMPAKSLSDNLDEMMKVWPEIIRYAKENNVKIAIENCPMLFSDDEWPGGKNLFTSPAVWRKVFELISDDNFGINYDPSHFVWQQMDYIKPIYEFKDRLFHVHFKDMKIFKDKLDDHGVLATPLNYMEPKIPGLGDVNWSQFVSALKDIRYEGPTSIEIEDRSFEDSHEAVLDSIRLSYRYLQQFII